jgi:hypothetical protein
MRTLIASVLTSVIVSLCALPAAAQGADSASADDIDREPVNCIIASRIDRTEVIDKRTVLFYMRGGDIYRNQLSYDCPRLVTENRFSYTLRTSQLCSVDAITVLEYWGSELRPGIACGLGEFYPITAEEAEFLDADPDEQLAAAQAVTETKEEAAAPAETPAAAAPYDPTQYSTVDSVYREDE